MSALLLLLLLGPQDETVAVTGGTILTGSGRAIERGTVLIRGGKVAAVGADVAVPPGATVIDAAGKFVTPGIIDTHSHMGVYSWPQVDANSDGNESTHPVMPHVRAEDGINLEDPAFKRALAGGVTCVQVLPGSANMVGGESCVVKLRLGGTIESMKFGAPRGMKMASGENPKRVYGQRNQAPSTRMGNFAVLREHLEKAREYARKRKTDKPPDKDLKLEALQEVLEGKIRVHIHCYRQDEFLTFIGIAKEFGFKIASFQHGLETYKVAAILAREGIGVATWADWWGMKMEMLDGIPQNAAILDKAGVNVTIHSDSSDGVQRLWHEAAKCVRYGLPEEAALRAITLGPARILGVEARLGSIEEGKDADLAIFSRHPFDVTTLVEKTLIDGKVVFDRVKNKDYWGGVR
jgi:imidazolonepropionase-like amidohydrolase